MPAPAERVDLAALFQNAATALASNRETLNDADADNHNHGDNMVNTFQTIASAVAEVPDASSADQLSHAAQVLGSQASSGSGQMYAQNLGQAAEQLGGQDVTSDNALGVIGALLGAQPGSVASAQAGAADQPDFAGMLGGLLGGGGAASEPATAADAESGLTDLLGGLAGAMGSGASGGGGAGLGGLLGGLLGGMSGGTGGPTGGATAGNAPGFDLQDLLALGAGYLQAKNEGKDDLQAIAGTLLSASGLTGHRQQSGQIVLDSMLTDLAVAGR
jgi:hypothetical protein